VSENPRVIINPMAYQDLHNIFSFMKIDAPERAANFLEHMQKKIHALSEHPKMYRAGRVPGTREMTVKKKYIVVYEEDPKFVKVIRVLHTSQNWPRS
jgi:addiction module RelE/StbE family toxin